MRSRIPCPCFMRHMRLRGILRKKLTMKFDQRLLRLIPHLRAYLLMMLLLGLLTGSVTLLQALYVSRIIHHVFLAGQTLSQLVPLLATLAIVILIRSMLSWLSELVAGKSARAVKTKLRQQLFAHLLALGPSYTQSERSGELANSLVEGIESLDAYFSQYLPQLFFTLLIPLVIVIAVFSVDPLSGLILLMTAPLLPFFMALIGMMANALTKRQWKLMSLMSAHFLDVLQGMTTLKLFGRSSKQQDTIRRMSEQFRTSTMQVLRVAFLSSLVLELGATISTAIIAVEIGLRLLYAQMDFSQAFFVLLLAPEFYLPLRTLGTRYHAAMSSSAVSHRLFAILATPVPIGNNTPSFKQQPEPVTALAVEHLFYTYSDQRTALQDVSFSIPLGQKVALVGASGAGKSTLVHLLMRFIEPNTGNISIQGQASHAMSAQTWRTQIALVSQRPYLFNLTVAENIRMGNPQATQAAVIQAAQQACAHDFIQALPHGYDTIIGERATRLSGGQAQRISLARALLKNAPLLILDEATANLDSATEAQVLHSLAHVMQGRTTLVVAHRLETIADADQIIVMAQGRIVETGTHQTLLQQQGLYYQLLSAYEQKGQAA